MIKSKPVITTLRIPGQWLGLEELVERLPEGYQLDGEILRMPDDFVLQLTPLMPDKQFGTVFRTACRGRLSSHSQQILDSYAMNAALSGPGGSLENAQRMMEAGAALIQAGGAGVFIDNSALSHDGEDWMEMADDGSSDALSFGFISIVHSSREIWTLGMHILGYSDIAMNASDIGQRGEEIIDVVRYISRGHKPIGDGHIIADEHGPRYQAIAVHSQRFEPGSPLFNPFGRLQLVSIKEIAENN
jgi:hypothetical protein